jgi:hypothetical protein
VYFAFVYIPSDTHIDTASSSAFPATSAHVSASASLLPPASSSVEHKSPLIAAADRHILELLNSSSVISVGGTQYNDDCRAVYAALERAVALRILLGPTSAPLAGTDTSVAAKTISPPVHEIPSVPIALSPAPVVSQSLGDPATTAFSPSASDVMRTPVTLKPDPAATVSASVEPSVAAFFQLHGHKDSAAGVLATVLADNNLDTSEIPVLTSIAPLELGRYFMASERWLRRHGSNHIRTLHSYSVKGINTLASVHVSLRDQLCGSAASTLTDVEFLALIKPFCTWDTFWANMQGFARLELAADCLGGWAAFCKWSTDLQRRLELTPNPPSPTDVAKFVLKNGVSPFVPGTATTHGLVRATGPRRPAPVTSKMMTTPTIKTTLLLSPTPARTHRRLKTGLSPSTLHHPVATGTMSPPSLYAHRIPLLFSSPATPSLTPLSPPSPTACQTWHLTQTLLLLLHPATVCNSTPSLISRLPTTTSTLVPFNRTSSTPTTSSSTALA